MDSVIPLPITTDVDPNKPSLAEAVDRIEEEVELSAAEKLQALASKSGNFAEAISAADLARIGIECVEDYEQDKKDRDEWEKVVLEALDSASQTPDGKTRDFPWKGAANIKYPSLTVAAMQFNARMYPAVVKGDEAVLCKVIGQDNGRPMMGPDGQPLAIAPDGGPISAAQAMNMPPEMQQQLQPAWQIEPGAKARRARRVSEYMNTTIFYRMEDWETDTDALLMQLPVVGCVFRKLWYDAAEGVQRAAMVPALRIFVPKGARSVATTPRLTEEMPDVYPHEISERIRGGFYRDPDENLTEEQRKEKAKAKTDDGAKLLLEQHRLIDLDDDGAEEPYIVTVDHETQQVLRIEANFGPEDVKLNAAGEVMKITRGKFYVKYPFLPDPKGGFYDLGLGHLLKQLGDVVNTCLNQLMDAGTAQVAGGGFMGSGVRLQSRGGGSVIRTSPGEWKTVDVPGDQLRNAMVPFTLPNVSPVTFQVLDLILGAARDISGAKDVITGEASNNGQVGTTLALIEQGLQVFNATAKRTFRSLKEEFTLLKENIRKYGGEAAAEDYLNVLDDPDADFERDFNSSDMDIRPVSDPSSVTRMQKMAKAQFVMSTMEALAAVGGDPREALRRTYEAADVEDIDKLLPPPQPPQPDPKAEAEGQAAKAKAMRDEAAAMKDQAKAGETGLDTQRKEFELQRDVFVTGAQLGALG